MKQVFGFLKDDIYLSQINIPGTHDSCTAYCSLEKLSRCQSMTVKEQLEAGIRLFDLRLCKSRGELYLVHSLADCFEDEEKRVRLRLSCVLDAFSSFLRENPRETLVVSIKQDRGIMNRFFFPSFYKRHIEGNEALWYLGSGNPTLGECRGKMVLMRRCKLWHSFEKSHSTGLDFSRWPDQSGKRKTGYERLRLAGKGENALVALVQDRYSLEPRVKWKECAMPFLQECEATATSFALHFFSTSHREKGEDLLRGAEYINGEFMKHELKRDKAQGFMLFDFPAQELIDKVIRSNLEIYKENL